MSALAHAALTVALAGLLVVIAVLAVAMVGAGMMAIIGLISDGAQPDIEDED